MDDSPLPGEPPSDEADAELRQALLQTFLVEADERLTSMEEALVALERGPDDGDLLQAIFREAHTLKGNAWCLGLTQVSEFAHAMEDLLQRLRAGALNASSDLISLLLHGVDALRRLVPEAAAGRERIDPDCAELQRRFRDAVAHVPESEVSEPDAGRASPVGGTHPERKDAIETARTLRIDIGRLDRMLDLTGEIAIVQGRLTQLLQRHAAVGDDVLEVHHQASRLFNDLQDSILKARMVPIGPLFRQFVRPVRDIAHRLGKSARLVIEGDDVEVDTTIVEQLKDPITHMIRNALDHGLERPEVRRAKGKETTGRVTLRALHQAGHIVIEVQDDGAGLDRQKILDRAVAMGLVAERQHRSDRDTFRLIFEPGFSTSDTVTELSGRGIGMDVVRRNVDALRGSVAIESRRDAGTTVTVRLPLTLAIIDGFGVGVGDEVFVIPLSAVAECLEFPTKARGRAEAVGVLNLRGHALPYARLGALFGRPGPPALRENVVVVHDHVGRAGLVVDALLGARQAVIKPLGRLVRGARGVSGATILGDGRVALILDVPSVLRRLLASATAPAA